MSCCLYCSSPILHSIVEPNVMTKVSDVPGGNRIRIINIKAQQSAFNKAIRTRLNENI